MPHLLTISVSPRDATSWSRRTLDRFVTEYQAKFSDATVHNREVYDLPHLSFDALVAGRTPQEDHGPEQAAAFALQDEIVNEIERADHLVIATPMYNWSAPSALKAWVDHVVNRRTYYGAPSVFAGKEVTIIISSGGLYSEGEKAVADGLRPWLRIFFEQLGFSNLHFINCDPTGPMDAGVVDPEDPASAWSKARRQVSERIATTPR